MTAGEKIRQAALARKAAEEQERAATATCHAASASVAGDGAKRPASTAEASRDAQPDQEALISGRVAFAEDEVRWPDSRTRRQSDSNSQLNLVLV
eukprot:4013235-Prymnesium_polylepis.1